MVRQARGSDNWPMTWADNDLLYTAYGDGNGFAPFTQEKLSMGLAAIAGLPSRFLARIYAPPGSKRRDKARPDGRPAAS